MPEVSVTVNGRPWLVACDVGQEDHLRDLAALVDDKVKELTSATGTSGDSRLLLMAALLLADERHEAQERLKLCGDEFESLEARHRELHARLDAAESAAAGTLETATAKLERIAAALPGA